MLSLGDEKWRDLHGGYRRPYDASAPLRLLQDGGDVWDELWNELHHQGDVDVASYASVPQLVRIAGESPSRDWNFYGLVATIEVERHRKGNPTIPDWLKDDYNAALAKASSEPDQRELYGADCRNCREDVSGSVSGCGDGRAEDPG